MAWGVNEGVTGARVHVGLSGGVDSAVTAAILKEAGADVTGVFIKGWYPPELPCTWREDRRDAMRVAARLRIPFKTLEAGAEYKQSVIDYLIREYRAGRTPNPDIMCNRDVKFGAFHRFAKDAGAAYIATGHYARAARDNDGAHLLRGIDEGKDQSYFLWAVPREALADTVFPLGDMRKEDVRKLAARFGLPNATKKDSQGICFLGPVSIEDFLRAEMDTAPGKALTTEGKEIGVHEGAVLYTLGERAGLVSALPGPWYVHAKDLAENTLTVSHERLAARKQKTIALIEMNWLSAETPAGVYEAQYRYHGPRIRGTFDASAQAFVPEETLIEPIASGQSLVLYQGEECVGGGIIR